MTMRTRLRWLIFVGTAGLVVAALWWRTSRMATSVETALVVRGTFEESLVEDGRTRVRWHVDVTAPVAGEWNPAALRVGDRVTAGRELGTLTAALADPASQRQVAAELGVAEATLTAARAAEAAALAAESEAARALGRAERLGTAGGVADEELDRIRTIAVSRQREREAARARVTAAEFGRDAARARLPGGGGIVRVNAPGVGVVLRVDEEHPRVVPAGTPLLMIGALGALEVVVDVLSTDAARIGVGVPLRVLVGTDTARGRVLRVEPVAHTVRSALGVDEQRVSVIGALDDSTARLGHDFEVRTRIVLGTRPGVLIVPSGALVRDGDAWSVFVVDESRRVHASRVTLLARGSDTAAIEGLAEGARVVVYPPEAISGGARVSW
ncbi:MAG: HlyD family efflux transporter periplasmic adaptor subunit [Gemmatimonadetes bacterium]|nr:HlyD family efflux transporter periplasmic adaptor subunit [Gemmatimonadota bacterium]